jgi:hypothetical protein
VYAWLEANVHEVGDPLLERPRHLRSVLRAHGGLEPSRRGRRLCIAWSHDLWAIRDLTAVVATLEVTELH